jgi:hypothetical protein
MSVFKKIYTDIISSNGGISILPFDNIEVLVKHDPISDLGIATKRYVDENNVTVFEPATARTSSSLPPYSQAGEKVGSTLTALSNGNINDVGIDGVVDLSVLDRILVDGDGASSDVDNGIYSITDLGSVTTPWILTRSDDADTNNKLNTNSYVFIVSGLTFAKTGWIMVTNIVDIDVNDIIWKQFSESIDYNLNNVGTGVGEIAKNKIGNTLNFKTITTETAALTITNDTDEVKLTVDETQIRGLFGVLPVHIANSPTYAITQYDCIISCQYSNVGQQTITLPSASLIDLGKTYHIIDAGGNSILNTIIINSVGGMINNSQFIVLNSNQRSISVYTNGTNWFIF